MAGENYVFGVEEKVMWLFLNTQNEKKQDHMAIFLRNARDYARAEGFKGWFLSGAQAYGTVQTPIWFDAATVPHFKDLWSDGWF